MKELTTIDQTQWQLGLDEQPEWSLMIGVVDSEAAKSTVAHVWRTRRWVLREVATSDDSGLKLVDFWSTVASEFCGGGG